MLLKWEVTGQFPKYRWCSVKYHITGTVPYLEKKGHILRGDHHSLFYVKLPKDVLDNVTEKLRTVSFGIGNKIMIFW